MTYRRQSSLIGACSEQTEQRLKSIEDASCGRSSDVHSSTSRQHFQHVAFRLGQRLMGACEFADVSVKRHVKVNDLATIRILGNGLGSLDVQLFCRRPQTTTKLTTLLAQVKSVRIVYRYFQLTA